MDNEEKTLTAGEIYEREIALANSPTEYFVSEKGKFIVFSFSGEITYKSGITFEEATKRMAQSEANYVILSFAGIDKVDRKGISFLIKMQKEVRDEKSLLRICNLSLTVKKMLDHEGALRISEVKKNIQKAIASIIKNRKIKKARTKE